MRFIELFFLFLHLFYRSLIAPSILPNFNFLILGLDPRDDVIEKTNTTDTIILGRLDSKWQVSLASLPRDLWYYPISAKINQIYPQSLTKTNQYSYIQNHFSDLSAIPIDRTIIITTQNLQELVEIIGGVDVNLEKGFTDSLYPNPEYIKNPSPQTPIYITVTYPGGLNHLDSTNIAPFVRSRHGSETAAGGGTDLGRIERQQLLINALVSKLKTPSVLKNPTVLFKLYDYWHQQIQSNFTDLDFASLFTHGYKNISKLSVKKITIPTGENPTTDLIYHPQTFSNPQWVFLPQDPKYKSLQDFIHQQFAILNY